MEINSNTSSTEEVKIEKISEPAKVVETKPSKPKASFEDKTPCNWVLTPEGEDIIAVNNVSGERFEGSIEDFNKALRG